jgi:hypothetical protein
MHQVVTEKKMSEIHASSIEECEAALQHDHVCRTIHTICISTEGGYALSPNLLARFAMCPLKVLKVNGPRWWDLTMENLPSSIEELSFISVNLPDFVCRGMASLIHLTTLEIDSEVLGIGHHDLQWLDEPPYSSRTLVPLSDVPNLKRIRLSFGFELPLPVCKKLSRWLKQQPFFALVAYRMHQLRLVDWGTAEILFSVCVKPN